MMAYAFSTAPLHTLLMHASVVTNGGSACLFLGKSGTGKSTHTRLWLRQIPGTRLLNDDNPVIRLLPDGTVRAYGSPWSGKTPCYVSEDYPVAGIVRLEQAPENRITPLTGVRAFAALLPSCSCLRQDAAIYKGIVESVTELAQRCPVHHLQCLPNEEAARMSFNSLNPRNPMHS